MIDVVYHCTVASINSYSGLTKLCALRRFCSQTHHLDTHATALNKIWMPQTYIIKVMEHRLHFKVRLTSKFIHLVLMRICGAEVVAFAKRVVLRLKTAPKSVRYGSLNFGKL